MDTILVTGATGFIGSHLISSLIELGFDVRAYSRQTFRPGTTAITCQTKWIQGELDDWHRLDAACNGVDAVVHCAGIADSDANELETLLRSNSDGTKNVFLAAANSQVKKFLYMSTVHASAPAASYYSQSKSEAELFLCSDEAVKYPIQRFILRLGNVYGPGMKGSICFLIRYAERGWLPSLSRLNTKLSLVSIKDLCRSIVLLLGDSYPKQTYKFSVTDGHAYTFERLEAVIYHELGYRKPNWALPRAAFHAVAFCAQFADLSKIKKNQLGSKLHHMLSDGPRSKNDFPILKLANMATLESQISEIIASMES